MVTPNAVRVVSTTDCARVKSPCGRRASQAGFTLIELMIGLVLVAVLLSIGVPMFRDFIIDQRARATSSDLSLALMLARSEAVKRNAQVVLVPAGDDDDWADGWTIAHPVDGEPDILNHVQPGDIAITEDADLVQVRFSPSGRALDAAVFEIDADPAGENLCRIVTLTLDGHTSFKKEACS